MPEIPELLSFLNSPLANATGWALLHFLWQGALIGLVLKASLYLLDDRKPSVRYVAGCTALGSLLMLPIGTGWLLFLEGSPGPVAIISLLPSDAAGSPQTGFGPGLPLGEVDLASFLRPVLPWIVLGWGLGVLGCAGRFARGAWQARRLRQTGSPVADRWQRRLAALSERIGLGGSVGFRESGYVSVPTVAGWWRPVLLVPVGFLSGLPPRQVEAVLLHELAHVRRYDALVARLQAACETLLFFHPATWWVSRRVRQAREACCDSVVVEAGIDRTEYARALVSLADRARGVVPSVAQAGASDGHLLERVRRILAPPEPPSFWTRMLSTGAALVFLASLPLGLAAITAQQPTAGSVLPRTEEASNASGEIASYVLTSDSSGHATLISTSPSKTETSLPQEEGRGPADETELEPALSGEGAAQNGSRIKLENLHRSVRKNLDLHQIKKRLERPITTDRLRKALRAQVHPDSLKHLISADFGRKRLKQAVRKEVTDSLGRTLRKKLSSKNIELKARIRVDLGESDRLLSDLNRSSSESTQMFFTPEGLSLTSSPEPTAHPDSLFSQALSESLSNTVLVLGANATVTKAGESGSDLSLREPTS